MSEYGKRKDMDNNEVTTALQNVKWKVIDATGQRNIVLN